MTKKLAGLTVAVLAFAADGNYTVPFPTGFGGWTFLNSAQVGAKDNSFGKQPCVKPCTGGIFYFYANDKAMQGLRTGKYAEGSIFADEFLELHGSESGGAREGPRRGVGVMAKDSQRYASTGGWGYASFDPGSQEDRTPETLRKACFQCHTARKDKDFVFSQYRQR